MRCLYQGEGVHLVYVTKVTQTHGHMVPLPGKRVSLTLCLTGSQPANLPAAIGQPTSHVTKYQPVRLWVCQMVVGGQGAQPHWAPVQGLNTPTGSPWGMTYLTKTMQVTQMSSAAHYIQLALLSGTICSFVSMSPNHILLHEM